MVRGSGQEWEKEMSMRRSTTGPSPSSSCARIIFWFFSALQELVGAPSKIQVGL